MFLSDNSLMTTHAASSETLALLQRARAATPAMATLATNLKNKALCSLADLLQQETPALLAANAADLARTQGQLSPALYQRLHLDAAKLQQLAQGIRDVARLPDPVGQVLQKTQLDEGLVLEKRSVPLGVVAMVFESRPDVIPQVASLILKSGNVVVLKGGREALETNHALMRLLDTLTQQYPALPPGWAQLVETREDFNTLLTFPEYLDLVIPRGSNQLVQAVMAATRVPVLGHADGICHLYVHASANLQRSLPVIIDAKAQYPAACNALETLLVDVAIAQGLLPLLAAASHTAGITLRGCAQTCAVLPQVAPATEEDWQTEYGEKILAVRVVSGIDEALAHIRQYGSRHTEGILAEDAEAQQQFLNQVDAASVMVNASTRFADGFRYGLGAEVGISTAKTHARGPVGLEGLVIYQYRLLGQHHQVASYVGPEARVFQHKPL
jgi:glutamate-5-semialdehyde dehydrogenase